MVSPGKRMGQGTTDSVPGTATHSQLASSLTRGAITIPSVRGRGGDKDRDMRRGGRDFPRYYPRFNFPRSTGGVCGASNSLKLSQGRSKGSRTAA